MTMSKVEEESGRDKYEPIKRLAMVQIQPPRNPSKPLTSFCIRDILGGSNQNNKRKHEDVQHFAASNKTKKVNSLADTPVDDIVKRSCDDSPMKMVTSAINNRHTEDLLHHFNKPDHLKDGFHEALGIPTPILSPFGIVHKGMMGTIHSSLQLHHRQEFLHNRHHSQYNINNNNNPFHRSQNKPVNLCTSRIVRPWDSHKSPTSPLSKTPPSTTPLTTMTSEDGSSDEDEEISVDDEDTACTGGGRLSANDNAGVGNTNNNNNNKSKSSVSPLDALMAMTSKTFAGLDNSGTAESKKRDQSSVFGKHQPAKKRRKSRTAFTNQQIYELEKRFLYQKYLTPADRDEIALSLGLTNAQVITWFQNRRAKLKRDLEELKSDVTAAKKLTPSKPPPSSIAEMDLRTIQEKTLRDSLNNGGLQSPSSCSMTSLSDDHDNGTPMHSPNKEEELINVNSGEETMGVKSSSCDEKVNNVGVDIEENSDMSQSPHENRVGCNEILDAGEIECRNERNKQELCDSHAQSPYH